MTCEHRDFAKFHHLIDLIGGAVFWIIQDTVSVSTVDHPQYRLPLFCGPFSRILHHPRFLFMPALLFWFKSSFGSSADYTAV